MAERRTYITPRDSLLQALPLGWDETHLEAYRDGFRDALVWALSHDEDEIQEVLDRD